MSEQTRSVTLAGGCFWCIEAAFEELDGVLSATSGYAGGHVEDPSYEAVCSGDTGHAEVVQVEYDPGKLAYEDLLQVFFTIHDPTQLNRQGPDVGTQYRSAVFYHDDEQREIAERFVAELEAEGAFDDEIVTVIEPLERFWEAEEYHQNYYEKQRAADGTIQDGYCRMYAEPKVKKVREKFEGMTKKA